MNVEQLRSLDEKCLTSADLGLLANLKTVWDVKISWETPYESCEILWSFFSENQKIKSICLRNGWDIKEIFLLSHRLSVLCHFRKPLVERCGRGKETQSLLNRRNVGLNLSFSADQCQIFHSNVKILSASVNTNRTVILHSVLMPYQ